MNKDLIIIKNHFGENFAKLCRELFPSLLEKEGLLPNVIMNLFADDRFLYEDIIKSNYLNEFKNYIYSFIDVEKDNPKVVSTPKKLLDEAGYILYECKTEEEIQSFKKYYSSGEELCTFKGGRLNSCYVFFAIKKDVDSIRREDFLNPQRQDKYGTSVISIQFYKGVCNSVSIKNRYNHTVNNPDATFSNDLDKIINGLTSSFEREYGFKIEDSETFNFELENYIKATDGKYYKFNYELNNIYYCPNNIVIEKGVPKALDKSRYIVVDYFIFDLKEKRVIFLEDNEEAFLDGFIDIEKIEIRKIRENKNIIVTPKNGKKIIITIDKRNRIIGYENENLTTIGNNFLYMNVSMKQLNLPKLAMVGNNFMCHNTIFKQLNLPKLKIVGNRFMNNGYSINQVYLPELIIVGDDFLFRNGELVQLDLPKLTTTGDGFVFCNRIIERLNLPELVITGEYFLGWNILLRQLCLPKLKKIKVGFMRSNEFMCQFISQNFSSITDDSTTEKGISTVDIFGRRR